jgi:flagellar protein FliT
MRQPSQVLHCYEQLAPLTERMLLQARRRDWGALPGLEEQCSKIIERLRDIEQAETLDRFQLTQKHRLLSRIRGNHDEIRKIISPQLVRLGQVLQSMQHQRQLGAYEQ